MAVEQAALLTMPIESSNPQSTPGPGPRPAGRRRRRRKGPAPLSTSTVPPASTAAAPPTEIAAAQARESAGGTTSAATAAVRQLDVAEMNAPRSGLSSAAAQNSSPATTGEGRGPRRRRGGRQRSGGSETAPAKPARPADSVAAEAVSDPGGEGGTASQVAAKTSPADARGKNGGRRRHKTTRPKDATPASRTSPSQADRPKDAEHDRQGRAAAPSRPGRPSRAPAPVVRETSTDEDEESGSPEVSGTREMLINAAHGEECRIAIVHEGKLEELFIERASGKSNVGNIYKGRVTNVEPSIQAAFVDFGKAKNGFLHISDVQPQYFPNHAGASEDVGRKIPRHSRPPIQKCFRRGQEVIVQITKEGVGTKGPTLTTYLSIPGRYLVMMPGMSRHGVSRKIEDESIRRQMRDLMDQLTLPPGMGFILRTAGLDRAKRDLQRDLNYLTRLWKTVAERVRRLPAPAELYQESDLITRTVRDVYTSDFTRIVVDHAPTAKRVAEFLGLMTPRTKALVEHYADKEPLFHRYGIEHEIDLINSRHVPLPSGGSLVIDTTEALVAIDVNSGKFRSPGDAEETAYQTNLEAAAEIARQLRLRDLGGLILCDFIDLRLDRHKRDVERALREALKKHKERARILRMSGFGIIEMTRQRQRPSVHQNIYYDCPHCGGNGVVKMPESVMLDVMRFLQFALNQEAVRKATVTVAHEVAFQLLNAKRSVLQELEAESGKRIVIRGSGSFRSDQVEYACEDTHGQITPLESSHRIPAGIRPAEIAREIR